MDQFVREQVTSFVAVWAVATSVEGDALSDRKGMRVHCSRRVDGVSVSVHSNC
jgi:hypothetical protein